MISPDGKAARFTITHEADPASLEGIANVRTELRAAKEAVKGSPLADANAEKLGGPRDCVAAWVAV
jgi:putative drug exporter of the RND superfamily